MEEKFLIDDSKYLNSLSLQLAEIEAGEDVIPTMLESISKYTKACVAVHSQYDSNQKAMIVKRVEADGKILNAIIKTMGSKVLENPTPLSDDEYRQILEEEIAIHKSLTEITFGTIPKFIDITFQKLTNITTFFGVAHIISGKLYGTTMLGFKDNQTHPTPHLLKSFAYMSALSLRRNIAERALIKSESHLRRITDNICDVVFTTDLNLSLTYISSSVEKLTGISKEQYLMKPFKEFLKPETIAYIKSVLTEEFEKEKNPSVDKNRTRMVEFEHITANGTIITLAAHTSFIRDDNGTPIGIQGVSRDITELKHKEQKLKDLNADKDRFMQILAHDLKNPMANLVSTSDVLQKYYRSNKTEKIEKFLNLFSKVSRSTYNLLEDLLQWSKAQSGKLQPNFQKTEITGICEKIILDFDPILKQKKISAHYPQESITISADKNMITTILRNLISNAIKFTKVDGEVIVSVHKNNDSVTISVADNGVGISPENQQKLWSFSNPHTTEGTTKEKGTGFGLLLCKEFVEIHGGKIWVESEPGKGSRFFVKLPQ